MPSSAVSALLTELIDYAGLFPPAALPLADVARNYAAYRRSPDAWALGRLVVPVARLEELAALVPAGERWPVSALLADDAEADLRALARHASLHVDTVEGRFASPHAVAGAMKALGGATTLYAEFPRERASEFLGVLRDTGARAKIRTGGITADAIPASSDVARFIAACATTDVPLKATAGLHHPLRGLYKLTYAADAPRAAMHGFLNVFLAAAFARQGMDVPTLTRLLDDGDASSFAFDDHGAGWCGQHVALDDLVKVRQGAAIAFGSCSFREPLDDLTALGLL